MKIKNYIFLIILSLVFNTYNCSKNDSSWERDFKFVDGVQYRVSSVIDGDTVILENDERVRYIGIDCPEIAHDGREGEFFGEYAKLANTNLVDKKTVTLYFDAEKRGKYRRVLAYVFVDTVFVNAWLVKYGYAYAKSYPPNLKYDMKFKTLENEAKSNNRGIWQKKLGNDILE